MLCDGPIIIIDSYFNMVLKLRENNNAKKQKKIVLSIILFAIIISLPQLCFGHNEHPSLKYSREANEKDPNNVPTADNHDDSHYHRHHAHEHIHNEHRHVYDDHDHPQLIKSGVSLDMSTIWLHSIGSTLLISAAPFLLLYTISLDNTEAMRPRLKIILAFASGGLLGDAFLHLIPHSNHSHAHDGDHLQKVAHSHNNEHEHGHEMRVGLWVLGGIIVFLSIEKLVRLLKGGGHTHSHLQSETVKFNPSKRNENNKNQKLATQENSKSIKNEKNANDVKITGYLNLAADFAHNFTDGLAIGASYLAGNSIGVVTTITILLHEVPHEIGDFAILIKSGCTKRQAMMLQLVTALGAVTGTVLALLGASGGGGSTAWVLPFTAGGFIYIATVSVLPELLEESTKLGQSIKEILAMLIGVGLMVFIAKLE